jgi:hypothetical protein
LLEILELVRGLAQRGVEPARSEGYFAFVDPFSDVPEGDPPHLPRNRLTATRYHALQKFFASQKPGLFVSEEKKSSDKDDKK